MELSTGRGAGEGLPPVVDTTEDVSRCGESDHERTTATAGVVEADGDGYHAYCPAFKGLHAAGETEDGAVEGARATALAYLKSMVSHGDPIPVGPSPGRQR